MGFTPSTLIEAGNYLNARLSGRTLAEAHQTITEELETHSSQLDELATRVVEAGVATWSSDGSEELLILRGRANLFDDVDALGDLERLRELFDILETKKSLLRVIEKTQAADGVHVFIGADNRLFDLSGCSLIVAPLSAGGTFRPTRPLGAIGVIGPTRINYARIIPMVDYTARAISRLMSRSGGLIDDK